MSATTTSTMGAACKTLRLHSDYAHDKPMYGLPEKQIYLRTIARITQALISNDTYKVMHPDATCLLGGKTVVDNSQYNPNDILYYLTDETSWREGFRILYNDIEYDEIVKCFENGNIADIESLGHFTCVAEAEPAKSLRNTLQRLAEKYGYTVVYS